MVLLISVVGFLSSVLEPHGVYKEDNASTQKRDSSSPERPYATSSGILNFDEHAHPQIIS